MINDNLICSHCGMKDSDNSFLSVKYRMGYRCYLCDRCVDKINSVHNGEGVDYYWTAEDCANDGLIPYPYGKKVPEWIDYIDEKYEKLRTMKGR